MKRALFFEAAGAVAKNCLEPKTGPTLASLKLFFNKTFGSLFQGHTVVGLEGIPFVAEQVFQDANLEYNKFYLPEIEGFVFKVLTTIS